jgi:hypothetical protein
MTPNKDELDFAQYGVFKGFPVVRDHSPGYWLPASHGENRGSSPLGSANIFSGLRPVPELTPSLYGNRAEKAVPGTSHQRRRRGAKLFEASLA